MPATSTFHRTLSTANDGGEDGKSGAGYTVDFSNRPLWLVRGRDRAQSPNDFTAGKA